MLNTLWMHAVVQRGVEQTDELSFLSTRPVYCLSYTTTLFTSRPCASLPLNVEVRVFP
jgi:hypothetical protein